MDSSGSAVVNIPSPFWKCQYYGKSLWEVTVGRPIIGGLEMPGPPGLENSWLLNHLQKNGLKDVSPSHSSMIFLNPRRFLPVPWIFHPKTPCLNPCSFQAPGMMTVRHGGFIKDADRFDASFFGLSPAESKVMDPQQRLLLEVIYQSFHASGKLGLQK